MKEKLSGRSQKSTTTSTEAIPQGLDVIELEVIEKVFGKLAARSNGHAPAALLEAPVYDPDE